MVITVSCYVFALQWDAHFLLSTGMGFSPSFVFLGLALVGFVYMVVRGDFLWAPRGYLPAVLLLAYLSVSIVWASSVTTSLREVLVLWSYFITIVVLTSLLAQSKSGDNRAIYWAYVLGVVSVGLVGAFTFGLGHRFTIAPGYNPTWYAAAAAVAIIIGMELFRRSSTWVRASLIVLLVIISGLLLSTQGRNSVLALGVSGLLVVVYRMAQGIRSLNATWLRNVSKAVFFALLFLVGFLLLTTYIDPIGDLNRFQLILSGDLSQATAGRTDIWANYMSLISDVNVFGAGVKSGAEYYGEHFGLARSPHNSYFLMLFDAGLPGLVLWISFQLGLVALAVRAAKRGTATLLWLALFLFFLGFGNDTPYYKYYWNGLLFYFFLLAEQTTASRVGKRE